MLNHLYKVAYHFSLWKCIAMSPVLMAILALLVGSMFAVRMSANAFLMNMGEADFLPPGMKNAAFE